MKTITKINKKSFLLKPISNQARKGWEQNLHIPFLIISDTDCLC